MSADQLSALELEHRLAEREKRIAELECEVKQCKIDMSGVCGATVGTLVKDYQEENQKLKAQLQIAVEALKYISGQSSTMECSRSDLIKLENKITKKAHHTLKKIEEVK